MKVFPDGVIRFLWNAPVPMPIDPQCDAASLALARTTDLLNRYRLTVLNATSNQYDLEVAGERITTVTRQALAAGIDLTAFHAFPTVGQSQEVLRLVQKRRQILLEAWVRDDPSPRLAGMFKDSKATWQEAAALEERIRLLCRPKKLLLSLTPVTETPAAP